MIYLDNAATTRTDEKVTEVMLPYFSEFYGNPSSIYKAGARSKEAISKARRQIASALGALPGEIYFTSGGSESDNWAIKAAFEAARGKGNHIITTSIEHPAVLRTCEYLERTRGAKVTYLQPDSQGMIDPQSVEDAVTEETILISIMYANNEVGTIMPVEEIGEIAAKHGIWFHTDAVQAFGHVKIDAGKTKFDMLSASGHKFYGPKGCGFLYIRKGTPLTAFIHGGAQERQRRAGTENVPAIVGMGMAAEIAAEQMEARGSYEKQLRDYMIGRLEKEILHVRLNGHRKKRLPNNVNMTFSYVQAESVLIMLDMQDICASGGSACSSGSLDPSHVLTALGCSRDQAKSTIRFTLSYQTTKEEIDTAVAAMKQIVSRLRSMSPAYLSASEHNTRA